jgi:hypothetical protein
MLTIRAAQIQAFSEAAGELFVQRALEYVCRQDGGKATAELADRIRSAYRRASGLGVTSERALLVFVVLSLEVGPGFDEWPGIRAALEDPRLTPDERVLTLVDRTSPADWTSPAQEGVL